MAQLNNQVQTLETIALEICFDQDTSSTHLLPLQLGILCSTLDLCLFGSSVSGPSVKIHCLAYRFLAKFVGHLNFTKCSKFFCHATSKLFFVVFVVCTEPLVVFQLCFNCCNGREVFSMCEWCSLVTQQSPSAMHLHTTAWRTLPKELILISSSN